MLSPSPLLILSSNSSMSSTWRSYADHDLKEAPVIVLRCGHLFTLPTLDGHVELAKYYRPAGPQSQAVEKALQQQWVDEISSLTSSTPSAPAPLPEDFGKVPTCPGCRQPITYIKRYGRPVKKALVDHTQRKYVYGVYRLGAILDYKGCGVARLGWPLGL